MTTITKPMLASKCGDPQALPFPVLATPKLDGIRCLKVGGKALTRSFKPVSNRFVREWIEANLPDGVDGELVLRGGTFSETTSAIGARDGEPDFVFHVFDYVATGLERRYIDRMGDLAAAEFDPATLESKLCKGLYAAGEVLDVDGDCGGFNLMFAFASGLLAGRAGR